MPLETLNSIDPKLARGALASTVLSLSGPGINDVPEQFRELSSAVLQEARVSLSIGEADFSPQAVERIRSFLAGEISRRVYEGFDKRELLSRLGSEGKLSIGAYSVKSSSIFKGAFRRESLSFATRCVRGAELVQHLRTDGTAENKDVKDSFSLFISEQSAKGKEEHYVLISAVREGDQLNVDTLWRIFPSCVDLSGAKQPIDFYRIFAEHYGVEFALKGVATGRNWLENIVIGNRSDIDIVDKARDREYITEVMGRQRKDDVLIRYAAAIDMGRYRADVTRRS